jgi:ABC-type dipeptide/oligopeptide/nickel transport system permease subunit
MEVAPWITIFPGIALSVTAFSFALLGDALRDIVDPRDRFSNGSFFHLDNKSDRKEM